MAATEATMQQIFGANTISAWSDADGDNNAGKKAARVAWAISVATATIYEYLRGLHIRVPAIDPDTATTPVTVEYAASLYAGLLLYSAYSMYENQDTQKLGQDRLQWFRDEFARILAEWKSGARVINALSGNV